MLSATNLSTKHVEVNLSKENLLAAGWIIPPSLRNNGLHCVFIQVRKLVGYFSSRVPFSLRGELSSFRHLKQGNGFPLCMAYASSHNGVAKKRFMKIWKMHCFMSIMSKLFVRSICDFCLGS